MPKRIPPGALRDRRRHEKGSRHDRKGAEEMKLGEPRDIETEFVGEHDLFDGFLVAGGFRLIGSAGELIKQAEFHSRPP